MAGDYLKLRASIFWFRRIVPHDLVSVVGFRELSRSLKTSDARLAKCRANRLSLVSEEILKVARKPNRSIAQDQAGLLVKRLMNEPLWESDTADEMIAQIRAGNTSQADLLMNMGADDLKELPEKKREHVFAHITRIMESYQSLVTELGAKVSDKRLEASTMVNLVERLKASQTHTDDVQRVIDLSTSVINDQQAIIRSNNVVKISPKFSEKFVAFLDVKGNYTKQTYAQNLKTMELWVELMGDEPVGNYTSEDADRFQIKLRRLPASHGKGTKRTALEEIARADKLEAKGSNVPRLSEKTVERHLSSIRQYWNELIRWRFCIYNIADKMNFPNAKAGKNARSDWSPQDLVTLLTAEYKRKAVPKATFAWFVCIALYSGMRLEEIGRLRVQDIQTMEDIPFFCLVDQGDWSPKSEAGERAVAIHPMLSELGFMAYVEERRRAGDVRLFPALRVTGIDEKLTAEFSRVFSKHKISLGFGSKIVFHSFRHTVITILRNQPADIRGEWIDATVGHESGSKSMGVQVYLKRVGAQNLLKTLQALSYPADVQQAMKEFLNANT
jgi:integrase